MLFNEFSLKIIFGAMQISTQTILVSGVILEGKYLIASKKSLKYIVKIEFNIVKNYFINKNDKFLLFSTKNSKYYYRNMIICIA